LYGFILGAEDLGVLRSDLADLRLVDDTDRQVPYVLFPHAGEGRVPLEVTRGVGAPESKAGSRYVLGAPAALGGRGAPLPLRRLELDFAEGFCDRPARLILPVAGGGRRSTEEVLFAGRLRRGAGRRDPVVIPLDGGYRGALMLEIEEGDNASLTLQAVH